MQAHRASGFLAKEGYDKSLSGTVKEAYDTLRIAAFDRGRKHGSRIELPGKRGKVGSAQHVKHRSAGKRFAAFHHHHMIGQTGDFINRVADIKDRQV